MQITNILIILFFSFSQTQMIVLAPDEFEGTTDYQSPFIKQKQQKQQQTPSPTTTTTTTNQTSQETTGQQQQRVRKKEKLANLKRSFLSKYFNSIIIN